MRLPVKIRLMNDIRSNLQRVGEDIEKACLRCGRRSEEVSLMAVSKTQPAEDVIEAVRAGQRLFGENRVQEAVDKFSSINEDYTLHMIGHLQRNKVKDAVEIAACIQSVDALRTAEKISNIIGRNMMDILIEVNTSGEDTKFGVKDFDGLLSLIDGCLELPGLNLRGLMTIAPFTADQSAVRSSFRNLYTYFNRAASRYGMKQWDMLSMGMSSDYSIAIEEGSTLVRVGTAIFGQRNI